MHKKLTVLCYSHPALKLFLDALGVPKMAQSVTIRMTSRNPVIIECEYIPADVPEEELTEIIGNLELSKPYIEE